MAVAQWAGGPAVIFKQDANISKEELVGEPKLSVQKQIDRARAIVMDRPRRELDELVADLLERPTVAAVDADEERACDMLLPAQLSRWVTACTTEAAKSA